MIFHPSKIIGDITMPRTTKSLTNTEIDKAKPAEKETTLQMDMASP